MSYNERIERVEVHGERFYRVSRPGKSELLLPSVTSVLNILDKNLAPWAARSACQHLRATLVSDQITRADLLRALRSAERRHLEITQEACDAGTQLHELVERLVCDDESELPDSLHLGVQDCFARFKQWWRTQAFTVLAAEMPVWCVDVNAQGYAGTLDMLVEADDGEVVLLDLKSSKTLLSSHSWLLQAVAYAVAVEQRLGVLPTRVLIVNVPRHGRGVNLLEVRQADYPLLFDRFQKALSLWRWIREKEYASVANMIRIDPR